MFTAQRDVYPAGHFSSFVRASTAECPHSDRRWADDRSTLFASRAWFDHWLAAFGTADSGLWSPRHSESDYQIPYRIESRRVGPVSLRVAVGAANSYTPQFDIVGTGAASIADLQRMMRELRVSALIFPFVSRHSMIARIHSGSARTFGTFLDACETAATVDSTGSWNAYVKSRGKARATAWRYNERRALKAGGSFEVLVSWDDVARVWDDILAVEASGWKGRGGTAIRQVPEARTFYEKLCRDLADAGKLRVFLHWRDDRIIAFKVCTLHAGRLSSLKIGYREEFSRDSPGQVLRYWAVKWAFEQPDVALFDMLGPLSDDKLRFSTALEELHSLYVFAPNVGGALALLRWSVGPRLKQWCRSVSTQRIRRFEANPLQERLELCRKHHRKIFATVAGNLRRKLWRHRRIVSLSI